jgi:hypothetical protein
VRRSISLFARSCVLALAVPAVAPLVAHARQAPSDPVPAGRWLPEIRYFEGFRADPVEPRHGAGLLVTNLLASRGAERPPWALADSGWIAWEVQAVAALGATLPLRTLVRWPDGGVVVTAQAGVVGRFRIERRSRDDLGQDWFMALPVEVLRGDWSGRARISHRSSHLGDEFVVETGAERIEFGGEALDVHVARRHGDGRVYAGGSWIFRSYTRWLPALLETGGRDRFLFQAGADGAWPIGRAGGSTSVVAGMDAQLAERTGWQRQLSAVGGVRATGARHALQLVVRVHEGQSALGQFFLTRERAWSLEFVAELP